MHGVLARLFQWSSVASSPSMDRRSRVSPASRASTSCTEPGPTRRALGLVNMRMVRQADRGDSMAMALRDPIDEPVEPRRRSPRTGVDSIVAELVHAGQRTGVAPARLITGAETHHGALRAALYFRERSDPPRAKGARDGD
jgi:hypothetical protein